MFLHLKYDSPRFSLSPVEPGYICFDMYMKPYDQDPHCLNSLLLKKHTHTTHGSAVAQW